MFMSIEELLYERHRLFRTNITRRNHLLLATPKSSVWILLTFPLQLPSKTMNKSASHLFQTSIQTSLHALLPHESVQCPGRLIFPPFLVEALLLEVSLLCNLVCVLLFWQDILLPLFLLCLLCQQVCLVVLQICKFCFHFS